MSFHFPDRAPARPIWLVTLADLALLLVGFFVLLQAHATDRATLAGGLRQGFGGTAAAPVGPAPLPVAAAAIDGFAPGVAIPPNSAAAVIDWARDMGSDPRTTITVTGFVDGSPADVDPATRSGAVLATDRARGLAAALASAHVTDRLVIATAVAPGRRAAVAALGFSGSRP